jgi:hypothetical protein
MPTTTENAAKMAPATCGRRCGILFLLCRQRGRDALANGDLNFKNVTLCYFGPKSHLWRRDDSRSNLNSFCRLHHPPALIYGFSGKKKHQVLFSDETSHA